MSDSVGLVGPWPSPQPVSVHPAMASITRNPKRSKAQGESVVIQVAAALERLLRDGHNFTSLGVQRISDEAGIARSSFYRYFPDKSALLIKVTELATSDVFSLLNAWTETGFDDLEDLQETLVAVVAQQREHSDLLAALQEVSGYDQDVARFWRQLVESGAGSLRERLVKGQKDGSVDPDIDPATTASFLVWGAERLIALHVAENPAKEDAAMARRLSFTFWAALGKSKT